MAAIAYYQDGDEELADQALDNADRLDPNDPVVASVRTAIAIDQYQADQAVIARARGRAPLPPARRRFRGPCHQQGRRLLSGPGLSLPEPQRMVALLRRPGLRSLQRLELFRPGGRGAAGPRHGQARHLEHRERRRRGSHGAQPHRPGPLLRPAGRFRAASAASTCCAAPSSTRKSAAPCCITTAATAGARMRMSRASRTSRFRPPSASRQAASKANGRDIIDREEWTTAPCSSAWLPRPPTASSSSARERTWTRRSHGSRPQPISSKGGRIRRPLLGGAGWSHSFSDRNVLTGAVFGMNGLDRRYTNTANAEISTRFHRRRATTGPADRIEGVSAALSHMIGFGDLTLHYGLEAQRGRTSTSQTRQHALHLQHRHAAVRVPRHR